MDDNQFWVLTEDAAEARLARFERHIKTQARRLDLVEGLLRGQRDRLDAILEHVSTIRKVVSRLDVIEAKLSEGK